MKGLAELTKTTLIGGLLIVLPIYLSILMVAKTLSAIGTLLSPVTAAIPAGAQFRQVIAVLIVLAVCFLAGIVVRTGPGLRAKNALERSVLERIPGYALVRGLTARVSGDEREGAFRPALVEIEDALSLASSSRNSTTADTRCSSPRCRRRRPALLHPAARARASDRRAVHAGGEGHLQWGAARGNWHWSVGQILARATPQRRLRPDPSMAATSSLAAALWKKPEPRPPAPDP